MICYQFSKALNRSMQHTLGHVEIIAHWCFIRTCSKPFGELQQKDYFPELLISAVYFTVTKFYVP